MNRQILLGLIWLTVFCIMPVFAQKYSISETVELNNIKISDKRTVGFISLFYKPLLSENGSVEFNTQSQTFVFYDTKSRLEFIKKFTVILDNAGLQPDEFFVKRVRSRKLVTETVANYILPAGPYCDVGEELNLARRRFKNDLLMKALAGIKVNVKPVETAMYINGLELTGTRKRVEMAKKIIALFNETDLDKN